MDYFELQLAEASALRAGDTKAANDYQRQRWEKAMGEVVNSTRVKSDIEAAITLLEGAGYRVTKPRARAPKVEQPKLNAVGKPYGANYDPKYKRRTPLTSIARLLRPMPYRTEWMP